jgi:glycosyltransferase involved in cell wall biosynthesis
MKVLIITNFVPYPPATGSAVRVFNLIRHISRQHDVSLITLYKPLGGEGSVASALRAFCVRVELVATSWGRSRRERWLTPLRGVWEREPRHNLVYQSVEMADKIKTLTENEPFDIVDIQRDCMAPYVQAISPTSRCRKILTLHDVSYVQYRRMMSFERDWRVKRKLFRDWLFMKQATLKYGRRFDRCVAVSELDRDILKRDRLDLDIAVVPNGVDVQGYPLLTGQPTMPTLLFVGTMGYPPNVDGAIFFCREIFPLIKQQVPDAKLLIVGRDPSSAVQALASDDVIVTGYVESVIHYYQQSFVSVVPLRAGSGTRLKILESMALGRPVVSTTLGCEGLAVTHGENILIADTQADFAAQTVRLLNDEELRQRLMVNGRRLVETTYDWQAIAQQLLQVYGETRSKETGYI